METSGPPVVWPREQVAEEGEGGGGGTIGRIFTCSIHIHTICSCIPTSDICYIDWATLEWKTSTLYGRPS